MKIIKRIVLAMTVLLLFAGVALAQGVQITKGPTVESTTNNSAVVAWSTNVSASTVVKYGTDPNNLNQTAQAPWGSLTHRVTIKNLEPGKTYYFQATSPQAQGSGTAATSQVGTLTTQGAASASNERSQDQGQFQITNVPVLEQVGDTSA